MPIVQRIKTHHPRMTPMKLSLIIAAIAVLASLALMAWRPADLIPSAKAGEMRMATQAKSWSEEWYEVQKAIPASQTEAAPTF